AARWQIGGHVVAVEHPHRVLLETPDPVVADHHDHGQVVAHERVDVHEREPGGAVAEQGHHLAIRGRDPGRDRVPHAGAEAAVGPTVEPAPGLVHRDVAPGVGDEVAAVAHHHGVAVQPPRQLAVDPGGHDR